MKIVTDFSVMSRPVRVGRSFNPAGLFGGADRGVFFEPAQTASLFQTTTASLAATLPGQSVARINDLSTKGGPALQAITAARPVLGILPASGRKNLLLHSEDLTQSAWLKQGVSATAPNTVAFVAGNNSANRVIQVLDVGQRNGQTFYSRLRVPPAAQWSDPTATLFVGSTIATLASVTATAEWQEIAVQETYTSSGAFIGMVLWANKATVISGLEKMQVTKGAAAAYQRVGSVYDVTEASSRSLAYLYRDGVDDALPVTLPDLGSNATIAFASDQAASILTGQTVAAGAFDILRHQRLFAMLVIDRALNASEAQQLAAYLDKVSGRTP
ncbi:MAG: hypothetical protein P8O10_14045 [Pseudorhodobacter sp.]|nr:hypothetical protein [Pseudorhodobacter sp.]